MCGSNETHTDTDHPFTGFLKWFDEGRDANGEPMPDLYSLNNLRMLERSGVLPPVSAVCSAYDEDDVGKSIFVVEYDRRNNRHTAADFIVREASDTDLRIDLFDIFTVKDGQMSYARESRGHPVNLVFDFNIHEVRSEGPANDGEVTWVKPRDLEWLWPLVGCAYGIFAEAA